MWECALQPDLLTNHNSQKAEQPADPSSQLSWNLTCSWFNDSHHTHTHTHTQNAGILHVSSSVISTRRWRSVCVCVCVFGGTHHVAPPYQAASLHHLPVCLWGGTPSYQAIICLIELWISPSIICCNCICIFWQKSCIFLWFRVCLDKWIKGEDSFGTDIMKKKKKLHRDNFLVINSFGRQKETCLSSEV